MTAAREGHDRREAVANQAVPLRIVAIRRRIDLAATLGFCAAIALPTVDQMLRPASARDARHENRDPTLRPAAPDSSSAAARWPGHFEKYYGESFGGRDALLGWRHTALLAARLPPNAILDVGPTGWIFYRSDKEFEAHRGVRTLTAPEMDRWILSLQDRKARMAQRGARFLFAIAPDKETIYPEFLPASWEPVGPTLGELFVAELTRRTDVEVVDLRPALFAEKEFDRPEHDDFVYYPRGTHWTSRGAFAATRALLGAFQRTAPAIRMLDRSDYRLAASGPGGEDSWAQYLYTPWLLRPSFVLAPSHGWDVKPVGSPMRFGSSTISDHPDTTLPNVLFLHDSFGPFMHPFLLQRCSRLRSEWRTSVNEAVVELEQPDIVLMVKAERMLVYPPEPDIQGAGADVTWELGPASLRWSLRSANPPPTVHGDARLGADGTWTTTAWSDRLEIETGGELGPNDMAVVHLDLIAPADGLLEMWSSGPGETGWSKQRRTAVGLVRGRNDRSIAMPFPNHGGRLLVRLGPKGAWRIRRFEFHVFER